MSNILAAPPQLVLVMIRAVGPVPVTFTRMVTLDMFIAPRAAIRLCCITITTITWCVCLLNVLG